MHLNVCWRQFMLVGLLLVSCKTAVRPPAGETTAALPPGPAAPSSAPVPDQNAARQRQQAAVALTERGRALMADGQIDPAMRLFEQALSLVPQFGPGYYYLAEAWLDKDNGPQARAFHRQAALYLDADGAWDARLAYQRRRIDQAATADTP